jgi:4-hydroxy-tetrahydrodipicolinate reductase
MAQPKPLRIAIAGALGRMGQVTAKALEARDDMDLAAAFGRPEAAGQAFSGVQLSSLAEALAKADVVIDFSTGQASASLAKAAAGRGGPALVIGSTGFSLTDEAAVREAARRIPIVKSGNYSLGVNLLLGLVEQAARALVAGDYDIEVFEAHHRRKVDAPSGTALMLGDAAARGRGLNLAEHAVRGRDGLTGAREPGAIGFSVMRGGGIVGEHSVVFAADDELITLAHSARDRSMFARGALEAARWVAGRAPGLYDMQDVLGLKPR